MNKKKSKNIFTKNNEYEKYFLFIISIIAIIFGILILLDIISIEDIKALPSDNVCAILFIVLGFNAGIISLYTIIKENRFNKIPKPKVYELIENYYNECNYEIRELFSNNGYKLLDDDEGEYPIYFYDNYYNIFLEKNDLKVFICLAKQFLTIEINISDRLNQKVQDGFFDYEEGTFRKIVDINENFDFDSLINMINNYYDEKADILIERYNQYKM